MTSSRSRQPTNLLLATIALTAGLLVAAGCSQHDGQSKTLAATEAPPTAPNARPTAATTAADEDTIVNLSNVKGGVPQADQRRFASPEEAAAVYKDAVAAKDRRTLLTLFGREGSQLVFAGDRVQDNNDLDWMAQRMNEYLHVDRPAADRAVLLVGKENWPFPIPLVQSGSEWFFDTLAGRDELLNRHIGEDELNAIAVCRAYVAAQNEYARQDRTGDGVPQYAQHVMSQQGKHDGLYWEVGPNEPLSPMGPLVAEAREEGYPTSQPAVHGASGGKPHPYKGYLFHVLKAQGDAAPGGKMDYIVDGKMTKGFALVASPNKYGASGIMTFVVAKDGKVYQKDLGDQTRQIVTSMTEYNPDKTWTEVKE